MRSQTEVFRAAPFTRGIRVARDVGAPAIVRAQGLTKVKITQPSESLSYMPIYVGRAKDFFKEAGIDLQLVVTRGDGPDVQALMAKEVEFVATPPHHLYTLVSAEPEAARHLRHPRPLRHQHGDLQGRRCRARRVTRTRRSRRSSPRSRG